MLDFAAMIDGGFDMSEQKRGCEQQTVEIGRGDLPLCCPLHDERVWDAHPRVYLAIEDTTAGEICCPYCSTSYRLVG